MEGVVLREILLLLIKEAVLQGVSAVRAGRSLARPLILLNGLVEAVELAEQGHVQLSQADLKGRGGEVKKRSQHLSLILVGHSACRLPMPAHSFQTVNDSKHHSSASGFQF